MKFIHRKKVTTSSDGDRVQSDADAVEDGSDEKTDAEEEDDDDDDDDEGEKESDKLVCDRHQKDPRVGLNKWNWKRKKKKE